MSQNSSIESINKVFRIIYLFTLLVAVIAILRIVYIQFFKPDRVSEADFYKTEVLEPTRGSILSYDGKPMAITVSNYKLRWDAVSPAQEDYEKGLDSLAICLSKFTGDKSVKSYKEGIRKARKNGNRYYDIIDGKRVNYRDLQKIREFPIFRLGKFQGGLIAIQDNEREKPFGRLANRTIGYLNNDGGGTGIEYFHNNKLKGEKGFQKIYRLPGGDWVKVNGEEYKPAVDGYDIRTTIDVLIQEIVESELKAQLTQKTVFEGGTAVVMDVSTGAVRAIANLMKKKDGKFDESYNYAINHATEPGSTLKLAALTALIEDGYVDLDTPVDAGGGEWYYGGIRISDTHHGGYGQLTAKTAFEKSSNIAFAKMVTSAYEDDPSEYVARIMNMKLTDKIYLDLIKGEIYATITTPEDKEWSKSTLASLGFGYALTLTPLHTLTFYNTIANDGKMMRPYFIEDYEKDGIIYEDFEPVVVSGSICSKSTVKKVKEALRGVVTEGTARICNDERYQIAGKTGTARIAMNGRYEDANGYRRHQASFAGYFPADNPKYSCIVILYTGKTKENFYGGSYAAPIFKRIADKVYALHPEWNRPIDGSREVSSEEPSIASGYSPHGAVVSSFLSLNKNFNTGKGNWVNVSQKDGETVINNMVVERNVVPNVLGMGLKDALYLLENEGYRVSFRGKGRVVSQTPESGTVSYEKGLIEIFLK